jgi:hypothetical protein
MNVYASSKEAQLLQVLILEYNILEMLVIQFLK